MAFANARTLNTGSKTNGKKKAREVVLTGLEQYAAIDKQIKTLKALCETIKADLNEQMVEVFIEEGTARKAQPENFKGTDGRAEASCQLRKQSSTVALNEETQKLFAQHGLPTEVSEQIAETFVINPAYLNDQAMLGKVEKALGKLGLPSDFIMKQEGRSKVIAGENALDVLFSKVTDEETLRQLLPLVGTLAIRPILKVEPDQEMGVVLDIIRKLLNPTHEEKAEEIRKAAEEPVRKRTRKTAA